MRENTLWPDISRRVCRGQFRWAEASAKYFSRRTRPTEVPLGGAAAKNGWNLIRGLRAANSARLFDSLSRGRLRQARVSYQEKLSVAAENAARPYRSAAR